MEKTIYIIPFKGYKWIEMAKRGLADTANVLGGFFIGLALTVYVMAEVFKNIKGLTGIANTTVEAIKTGGYGALAMAVIIGIVLIANIIMGIMKSGGQ